MSDNPEGFTAQEWAVVERTYPDNTTQETNVTEQYPTPTAEPENPAVSKLREAFDTARNAILEGTELAKIVADLRETVKQLTADVNSLRLDLDHARNRNRELDEQVMQVRQSRDQAMEKAAQWEMRATNTERERDQARRDNLDLTNQVTALTEQAVYITRARDDMELRALDAEEKLKAAEVKLAKIEEVFGVRANPTPAPEQPRNESGQFQSGSQGSY